MRLDKKMKKDIIWVNIFWLETLDLNQINEILQK